MKRSLAGESPIDVAEIEEEPKVGIRSNLEGYPRSIARIHRAAAQRVDSRLAVLFEASSPHRETLRVLAAVIQCSDRYLICQRPPHKRHGGLWEFPGGKLEPGEALLDAAIREVAEELDVRVTGIGVTLLTAQDLGSEFTIEFVPTFIEGEPRCMEHTDIRWLTLDEIQHLSLAPSDRQAVDLLVSAHSSAPIA